MSCISKGLKKASAQRAMHKQVPANQEDLVEAGHVLFNIDVTQPSGDAAWMYKGWEDVLI